MTDFEKTANRVDAASCGELDPQGFKKRETTRRSSRNDNRRTTNLLHAPFASTR